LDELARQTEEPLEVRFVCDRSFETQARKIIAESPLAIEISVISAGKLRRYKHFRFVDYITTPSIVWNNLIDSAKTVWGFFESVGIILRFKPDVVFAKGGFVCLPMGFAAKVLGIPLVIHDSDARPGLTNRLLAPYARAIATGYPLENYTYSVEKTFYTGVPIRSGYRRLSKSDTVKVKQSLGFDSTKPLMVAMGGGLGAATINRAVLEAAPEFIAANLQVLLIAGAKQYKKILEEAHPYTSHVKVVDFVSTGMHEVLGAADIVLSRASATALQELAVLGTPTIAVPSRALADQHKNAAVYAAHNAAIDMTDDRLEAGELASVVTALIRDVPKREKLSRAIHSLAKPHAARDTALLIRDNAKR
jgi:UDP-N-acetylglucosamine--N-acetylmuramyl-(pentapeptide) pyrophosphoryl-undecaprenol N-acetylglucosamine transferase